MVDRISRSRCKTCLYHLIFPALEGLRAGFEEFATCCSENDATGEAERARRRGPIRGFDQGLERSATIQTRVHRDPPAGVGFPFQDNWRQGHACVDNHDLRLGGDVPVDAHRGEGPAGDDGEPAGHPTADHGWRYRIRTRFRSRSVSAPRTAAVRRTSGAGSGLATFRQAMLTSSRSNRTVSDLHTSWESAIGGSKTPSLRLLAGVGDTALVGRGANYEVFADFLASLRRRHGPRVAACCRSAASPWRP